MARYFRAFLGVGLLGACFALHAAPAAAQTTIAQTSHPIITQPFALLSSNFAGMGGEDSPTNGDRNVISSLGTTGVAKMKGGTYELGTGVVGGIVPSEANLDKAHAFPSPFMPSKGHTFITFSQVTANATIRIFTLTGELVKEIIKRSSGTDRISWSPVENEQGQGVASGVYVFVIEADSGQVKTGKLMIIK